MATNLFAFFAPLRLILTSGRKSIASVKRAFALCTRIDVTQEGGRPCPYSWIHLFIDIFPLPLPLGLSLTHTLGLALAFALVPNSCLQLILDHSC